MTSTQLGLGRLFHGDCLEVLKTLSAQGERFDLAYIDPPFNAGGTRGARSDQGLRASGDTAYRDAWGGLDRFVEMLSPRLQALQGVMAEDASIWIHLDYRAVHDIKVVADTIFGRKAFKGEIVWVPGNGGRRRNGPSVTHQTILIYALGRLQWNSHDSALREPYAETSQRMHFTLIDEAGRRYRQRTIGGKDYRYFADEGRMRGSVWTDLPAMRANTPLLGEATGYPTQKPEPLLERILRASSQPGDRVIDPMCGSGTTLSVAEKLKRPWVGIDLGDVAIDTVTRRIKALVQPTLK